MLDFRGASSVDFQAAFKDMIECHKPSSVLLIETKMNGAKAVEIIGTLGFPNYTYTDSEGNSGGVFVLCTNDIIGDILIHTK